MKEKECKCSCNCSCTDGPSNNMTIIFVAFLIFATLIISKAIDSESSKKTKEVSKTIKTK